MAAGSTMVAVSIMAGRDSMAVSMVDLDTMVTTIIMDVIGGWDVALASRQALLDLRATS